MLFISHPKAGEFQSGKSEFRSFNHAHLIKTLDIPLKTITHSFFQQHLIKPLLNDELHNVKERQLNQESRDLAFISSCVILDHSPSRLQVPQPHKETGQNDLACLIQPESWPNSTQVGGTHNPAGHFWSTASFAKSSKSARCLLEGGMARPRWLIKSRKFL